MIQPTTYPYESQKSSRFDSRTLDRETLNRWTGHNSCNQPTAITTTVTTIIT